jgi:nucleotide-binding universal stress UspA family protein
MSTEHSIVVGTDGSDGAQAAVIKAGRLAAATGGRVVVVAAYGAPAAAAMSPEVVALSSDGQERATAALRHAAGQLEAAGVPHEVRAVCGGPAQALCDVAELERADTIVVGSRGMRGARRLLGSVPNAVSHKAPCDVVIVKTD